MKTRKLAVEAKNVKLDADGINAPAAPRILGDLKKQKKSTCKRLLDTQRPQHHLAPAQNHRGTAHTPASAVPSRHTTNTAPPYPSAAPGPAPGQAAAASPSTAGNAHVRGRRHRAPHSHAVAAPASVLLLSACAAPASVLIFRGAALVALAPADQRATPGGSPQVQPQLPGGEVAQVHAHRQHLGRAAAARCGAGRQLCSCVSDG
jgi:hypothetical protein